MQCLVQFLFWGMLQSLITFYRSSAEKAAVNWQQGTTIELKAKKEEIYQWYINN